MLLWKCACVELHYAAVQGLDHVGGIVSDSPLGEVAVKVQLVRQVNVDHLRDVLSTVLVRKQRAERRPPGWKDGL